MSKGTYVVTGHLGFIGKHLTAALEANGNTVIGIDRSNVMAPVNLADDAPATLALLDIAMRTSDGVFHLAADADWRGVENAPTKFIENIAATDAVATAAQRYNKPVVFASTAMVYQGPSRESSPAQQAISETAPLASDNITKYALSKRVGEDLVLRNKESGMAAVARFFNVYGPGQERAVTYRGAMVPNLLGKLVASRGLPSLLFPTKGEPGIARDLVYVSDVVEALMRLMLMLTDSGGCSGVFNIGSGIAIKHVDVVSMMCDVLRIPAPELAYDHKVDPQDPAAKGPFYADISRAKTLGWTPRTSLFTGLAKTAESIGFLRS